MTLTIVLYQFCGPFDQFQKFVWFDWSSFKESGEGLKYFKTVFTYSDLFSPLWHKKLNKLLKSTTYKGYSYTGICTKFYSMWVTLAVKKCKNLHFTNSPRVTLPPPKPQLMILIMYCQNSCCSFNRLSSSEIILDSVSASVYCNEYRQENAE